MRYSPYESGNAQPFRILYYWFQTLLGLDYLGTNDIKSMAQFFCFLKMIVGCEIDLYAVFVKI